MEEKKRISLWGVKKELDALGEKLDKLIDKLEEEKKEQPEEKASIEPIVSEKEPEDIKINTPDNPKAPEIPEASTTEEKSIPKEYRDVVVDVLNSKFGIRVEPADTEGFTFSIIVPRAYSNMSQEDFKINGIDLRSRKVLYSQGVIGITEWCQKVFSSFDNEVKAQIVAERIFKVESK